MLLAEEPQFSSLLIKISSSNYVVSKDPTEAVNSVYEHGMSLLPISIRRIPAYLLKLQKEYVEL